jgi:23S rRNA pseudouridine1911/1915/1917 synthase
VTDAGPPTPTTQRFTAEAADAEVRLQQFLARRLHLSLSQTNRLLDLGAVRVDHWTARRKHKGYKLRAGQKVAVSVAQRPGQERAAASETHVEIIASDDAAGWVAVNKPAGMAVHPLHPDETGTVLNALMARYPQMHGVGEGGLRSGVVHRLDVETSGVLLFATRQETWQRLRDAFAAHETRKTYRAIVLGRLEGAGEERMLLHIARHKPAKVRIVDEAIPPAQRPPGTRLCRLAWRALEPFDVATLIEIDLGTGFLHQVRAMFAHLGHPVAGDPHYRPADMEDATGAARVMLHAAALCCEDVAAAAPDPPDFALALERLRGA